MRATNISKVYGVSSTLALQAGVELPLKRNEWQPEFLIEVFRFFTTDTTYVLISVSDCSQSKFIMSIKHFFLLFACGLILSQCGVTDNDTPPMEQTVFFLVAEVNPDRGDSYILPLSEAGDIAAARTIIANRTNEELDRLVVAKVVANDGTEEYLNKDFLRNMTWSWKVSEFYGFSGFTAEILDGGPQDVENDMDWWFNNTDQEEGSGNIGFWGYTVSREVSPKEIKK